MKIGYLYALTNRAFANSLIKIGHTTKEPDMRAKEISGATGVPAPFDIAFAFKVYDCKEAETKIHEILKTYRNNNKREFFVVTIDIARKLIVEICQQINESNNYPSEDPIIIDCQNFSNPDLHTEDTDARDSSILIEVSLASLKLSQPGRSSLTRDQRERLKIVATILENVCPDNIDNWIINFSRDRTPESEIIIWEHIAKAFVKIDSEGYLNEDQQKEAYKLSLLRSFTSTANVIERHKSKLFCLRITRRILAAYEDSPKPIIVVSIRQKSFMQTAGSL
jgi:hypothetical protein